MGELVNEHYVVGHPPLGDLAFEEFEHVFTRELRIFFLDDDQQRPFIPFWMSDADHCRFGYGGMADGGILQIDRADPFAA